MRLIFKMLLFILGFSQLQAQNRLAYGVHSAYNLVNYSTENKFTGGLVTEYNLIDKTFLRSGIDYFSRSFIYKSPYDSFPTDRFMELRNISVPVNLKQHIFSQKENWLKGFYFALGANFILLQSNRSTALPATGKNTQKFSPPSFTLFHQSPFFNFGAGYQLNIHKRYQLRFELNSETRFYGLDLLSFRVGFLRK